jgi:hypothetical protein
VYQATTIEEAHALALSDITKERARQVKLKTIGIFDHTPDEVPVIEGQLMLMEEVGEVARCILAVTGQASIQDSNLTEADLFKELTQVAAVACAMMEGMYMRTAGWRE